RYGYRRAIRQSRADRRLLADPDQIETRGARVGKAVPRSAWRTRRRGNRAPPVVRARRLRSQPDNRRSAPIGAGAREEKIGPRGVPPTSSRCNVPLRFPRDNDRTMNRPLLVVDGDSFAHRSYHALPKSIRRRGDKGGGAIVGFANFLLRLHSEERP